ncbi:MAG TPA: 4-(cytidine 5'-diphospho)-2-C-methyl-D-erythritol kinase [Bacillota bacterium]|nr:4-(cytidine 5'-diphospho)-2-C-methyl-D-erythritol kinase [Bacillota bacterium]
MAECLQIEAYAKVNLTLDVLGKRDDGYHEVEMVMQSVSLADTISLTKEATGVTISCDHPGVPRGEGNLAYRAAAALKEATGYRGGLAIQITKRIPLEAGLAGGSADAAAVLSGMNTLCQLGLSWEELMRIGGSLGSDVPFCIKGGTALATGRGEIITPLPSVPTLTMVLVKPDFGVSTAQVYGKFRRDRVLAPPDNPAMLQAIKKGDKAAIIRQVANALESVTLVEYPQVAVVKQYLTELGAKGVLMSGSGPTVFGFIDSAEEAQVVAGKMRRYGQTWVAETCQGNCR